MMFSFKKINNKINKYNVNPEDKLSSIIPKLLEDNKIDSVKNTVKFIFKGKILNYEMLFGDFTEENIVIIYMISKIKINNKTIASQSNIYDSDINILTLQPNDKQPNISESDEDIDLVDKLRAGVIGTLVFIRTYPQLAELFNNNFETLINVMTLNEIKPLFEKMINKNCNGESEYLDNLSELLTNINSNK